jgi:CRISPR-associated protein Cmr5
MITRDQQRARHAYQCVGQVQNNREDYKIIVHDFGANIIRSGLVAAISFIERNKNTQVVELFFQHLATASIPNIPNNGSQLPNKIRDLELEQYILVTREILKILVWFKRATQAIFD